MKKSGPGIFLSGSTIVIILTMFCMSMTPINQIFKSGVNNCTGLSEKKDTKTEIPQTVIKKGSIEAVIPFIHQDLCNTIFQSNALIHCESFVEILYSGHISYIDKYLKTLFLFIIAANAP